MNPRVRRIWDINEYCHLFACGDHLLLSYRLVADEELCYRSKRQPVQLDEQQVLLVKRKLRLLRGLCTVAACETVV